MSIKSDKWITKMALKFGMIDPFIANQVSSVNVGAFDKPNHQKVISYGVSSYGYDIRVADEFKIFTNINSTVVDPKNFNIHNYVSFKGNICVIPPNSFALGYSVEHFDIPRNILAVCLGKSTYARCFVGDTKIVLLDNTEIAIKDLVGRNSFNVYSCKSDGTVVAGKGHSARITKHVTELIEITLDNNEIEKCTPDHEWMLRDGTYKEAQYLQAGDSLMPLYRKVRRNGRSSVLNNHTGKWSLLYRIIKSEEGKITHHVDGNIHNNNPDNLQIMNKSEHTKLHYHKGDGKKVREGSKKKWKDKDFRSKMKKTQSTTMTKLNKENKENWKSIRSQNAKTMNNKIWNDDEFIKRHKDRSSKRMTELNKSGYPSHIRFHKNKGITKEDCIHCQAVPQPNNHKVISVKHIILEQPEPMYDITVDDYHNFSLGSGVFVHNCGVIVNVTPFEPEWTGHATLEISNTTNLPAYIYANEGLAQLLFFQGDEPCEVSYADKKGKYQNQGRQVTLPKG